jgi:hypothetical protein
MGCTAAKGVTGKEQYKSGKIKQTITTQAPRDFVESKPFPELNVSVDVPTT